jgi:hypothetical protein
LPALFAATSGRAVRIDVASGFMYVAPQLAAFLGRHAAGAIRNCVIARSRLLEALLGGHHALGATAVGHATPLCSQWFLRRNV